MSTSNLIISVYKTGISESDLIRLQPALEAFDGIVRWTVDLEDWENILRIESNIAIEIEIIKLLHSLNIECDKLL
jgi:hypothetical protein